MTDSAQTVTQLGHVRAQARNPDTHLPAVLVMTVLSLWALHTQERDHMRISSRQTAPEANSDHTTPHYPYIVYRRMTFAEEADVNFAKLYQRRRLPKQGARSRQSPANRAPGPELSRTQLPEGALALVPAQALAGWSAPTAVAMPPLGRSAKKCRRVLRARIGTLFPLAQDAG